jgi:RNA polymerase sigma factor for flagellar operon FliA
MLHVSPVIAQADVVHLAYAENLFWIHRSTIEQAIRLVCRRHRLPLQDAEDFASDARIHFMENDFAALRGFRGDSSLSTYILTVVTHFGQDWRNARWGKWRPSAEARRQGALATHLERLMHRDGLPFEEACETLILSGLATSRRDVDSIAATLPVRIRRRFVPDAHLEDHPAAGPAPDAVTDNRAATASARPVVRLLAHVIASMPPGDVVILQLRFGSGLRVVEIAQALRLEQKPLYSRIGRLLSQLRSELEHRGLAADLVRDLLVRQGFSDADDARASRLDPGVFPAGLTPS